MGRPSKPIKLVKGHRTKAEKEKREKEEKRLLTGTSFKPDGEVSKDPIALKEFLRLKKLFKKIDKDDGLHENLINRYCKMHSACFFYKEWIEKKKKLLEELETRLKSNEIDVLVYLDYQNKISAEISQYDTKLKEKWKMMLDIEKESLMTFAAAMRAIPKKPDEEKEINPFDNIVNYQGR
jgi:sRNA-binding regulator protein Hfq